MVKKNRRVKGINHGELDCKVNDKEYPCVEGDRGGLSGRSVLKTAADLNDGAANED